MKKRLEARGTKEDYLNFGKIVKKTGGREERIRNNNNRTITKKLKAMVTFI